MNTQGKINFIDELVSRVAGEIKASVAKMPEDWDGIELRAYVAERFSQQGRKIQCKRRRKDYENEVLVRNL